MQVNTQNNKTTQGLFFSIRPCTFVNINSLRVSVLHPYSLLTFLLNLSEKLLVYVTYFDIRSCIFKWYLFKLDPKLCTVKLPYQVHCHPHWM